MAKKYSQSNKKLPVIDKKIFARALKEIRERLGFDSQRSFAREIGLNQGTYQNLEAGKTTRVPLETFWELRRLGINADELIFCKDFDNNSVKASKLTADAIHPPFIGDTPQEDLAINQAFLDKLGIRAGRAVLVIAPDGSRAHQRIYKGDWIISEKTDVINRGGVYFCREGDIEVMREFQPRGDEFVMVPSLNSSETTADTYRGEPLARLGVIFARLDGGGLSANYII
jgi:transcriptional regulator with XRE-family HTH domain